MLFSLVCCLSCLNFFSEEIPRIVSPTRLSSAPPDSAHAVFFARHKFFSRRFCFFVNPYSGQTCPTVHIVTANSILVADQGQETKTYSTVPSGFHYFQVVFCRTRQSEPRRCFYRGPAGFQVRFGLSPHHISAPELERANGLALLVINCPSKDIRLTAASGSIRYFIDTGRAQWVVQASCRYK